jgi:hypothetical protein
MRGQDVSWYGAPMTTLLDDALAAVRRLPPAEQDSIARAVLRLTGEDDEPPVTLSPKECAAVAASRAAAARGEFATGAEVLAVAAAAKP